MNLQWETIHQPGEFDLFVVEAANEFAELLLGRDYDPVFATTFHAEVLDDGLEIEHFLYVASNELANFVNNEHQGLAWASSLHQLIGTVRKLARRNISFVLDGLNPRIGHRVGVRIEAVKDATCFAQGKCNFTFFA
jgi:hypothetical protein